MYMPVSALLRRPSLVSRLLATLPLRVSVVTWSPFRTSWRFPRVSAWPTFIFRAPVIHGLPSVWAVTLEVVWFSKAPEPWLSCIPFSGGRRSAPPECLGARFVCPGGKQYGLSEGLVYRLSPPSSSCILMSGSSTPSANASLASLLMWSSSSVGYGGQVVRWPWQILTRIPLLSVSLSSVDCGKRRRSVDLRNGPLRPEEFPRKSRLSECRVAREWPGLARLWSNRWIFLGSAG
jgi:hypothetical protein